MPKLNQKKVITLRVKIIKEYTVPIEVNPSVRLTEIQKMVDEYVSEISVNYKDQRVEVTAEGLV